jgi:carbamate kinase
VRVVVALGGNAIARHGDRLDADSQRARVGEAVAALVEIALAHEVVVTHGNGPQVGLLALQAQAHRGVDPYPLDVLGAETEGQIGYLLESELSSRLPGRNVAVLLTQVEVDAGDPAFAVPTKPIGAAFDVAAAREFERRLGWRFAAVDGRMRRLVPSPEPRRIREIRAIELLVEAGVLVVCAGGGGIPVVVTDQGVLRGVEAVVDKDLTAALLARALGADWLLLLTDVPAVYEDWPEARRALAHGSVEALRGLKLDAGTMGPKVEAACRFAAAGGRAGIGRLEDASAILRGEAGTCVGVRTRPQPSSSANAR